MSVKLADRVKEFSTTTGTGDITVTGATLGHRRFQDAFTVGEFTTYVISNEATGEFEVGAGTYSAENTLTRDAVIASSNSGNLVDFSAGNKFVFVTYSARDAVTIGQSVAFAIALGG